MRFWNAFRIEGNEMKQMNITETICKKSPEKNVLRAFNTLENAGMKRV